MSQKLNDIVHFRGDRLFHGAVDISWFGTDADKAKAASEAFVFHGPKYHGVQQEDVGTEHGYQLVDTASLARSVVRRCYGIEDVPFTLAIAGYGTGKSHIGLTLASLLSNPHGKIAQTILNAIEAADADIGSDIGLVLQEAKQPCLVLTLNGMQSFDFAAEITRQVVQTLKANGQDPKPLDDLRPRFGQAASLIRISNDSVVKELLTVCDADSAQYLLTKLEQQDEQIYAKIHDFFEDRGMPISGMRGGAVRDVIDITVREYCGRDKPYRCILFLFDEFGKYTEFATVRSQIAGSGVLQDLFESIQANSNNSCFLGFIQFELNSYVQRVAPEYRNEILRYVTRYQISNKVYLSINMETLIANLLEKCNTTLLDRWFEGEQAKISSGKAKENIARWFPQSKNHRLWGDLDQFHSVICKGCWPLSPYSTWLLFYLAAAGKHLQERSVLALLGDVLLRFRNMEVSDGGEWSLSPSDLWSDALQQEFISSEETGQQGSSTHAYTSVIARHGSGLPLELKKLLCAVVLASKLGLQVSNKDKAIEALGTLSGIPLNIADKGIHRLQEEYNVLEWDEAFKSFDILGDAVPRNQFLSFVRQRVASSYDEAGKAKLFASKAAAWCDLLSDLECDFAEAQKIMTREWRYRAVTSNLDYLLQHIKIASDRWVAAISVDEPRGTIIYTYVEQSRKPTDMLSEAVRFLKATAREAKVSTLPILVVLLCDESSTLGQALAEYAVLEEGLTEQDRVKFGNLIGAHKEKQRQVIREQVESMIKQRHYATGLKEELTEHRLSRVGSELFAKIYKTPIPFPFDGFSTAKGNAADTCQELTRELFVGKLDYDGVIAKPMKAKNRALTVLNDTWGIFTKKGDVSRRPKYPIVCAITEKWDDALTSDAKQLSVADAISQVCHPPYGGNIASAGLLLSVFVAPRTEKLVVMRDGQQIAVSQWVQDGLFRGKFIDLSALHGVYLILLGEESSEWETLLDEWEQCDNHLTRKSCCERAEELKQRVPVPPAMGYREMHLREQALKAIEAIAKIDKAQNDAISKAEQGKEHQDVGLLTWGAVELKKICDTMISEKPLWTDSQIAEIQPHYERAKQTVILFFSEWLARQAPKNDAPDTVGDFKHKMLHLVAGNLKKLGLEQESDQVEAHTLQVIRKAETVVDARQLMRDVDLWLTKHSSASKNVRIADLRALKEEGKKYASKLQGLSGRISLPEIGEIRQKLATFIDELKQAENAIEKRASALWNNKLCSEEDMERLLVEVNSLISAYENLPDDQSDLLLMKRVLQTYQQDYHQLANKSLAGIEFEKLAEQLKQEASATFGKQKPPWSPAETIDDFVVIISKERKEASANWIDTVEADMPNIAGMSVADANKLLDRVNTPPAILAESHAKRLQKVSKAVELHLSDLKIDWLVEKFKELPKKSQKEFIKRIQEEIGTDDSVSLLKQKRITKKGDK